MEFLDRKFFRRDAVKVAEALLGCVLVRTFPNGNLMSARIVETEAYRQDDPACHAYGNWLRLQKGKKISGRSEILFGEPGFAYVYMNYGIHWLFNVVCDRPGVGAAVLIRAVEPLEGLGKMLENRSMPALSPKLTNGPGKLTQALSIDSTFNGIDLIDGPSCGLKIFKSKLGQTQVVQATRIGISKSTDLLWRFYLQDNPFVSVLNK